MYYRVFDYMKVCIYNEFEYCNVFVYYLNVYMWILLREFESCVEFEIFKCGIFQMVSAGLS
jgi:hypothetical protein